MIKQFNMIISETTILSFMYSNSISDSFFYPDNFEEKINYFEKSVRPDNISTRTDFSKTLRVDNKSYLLSFSGPGMNL